MGHYRSNLRDVEFNLFEFLRVGDYLGTGPFESLDEAAAGDVLRELERLAGLGGSGDRDRRYHNISKALECLRNAFKKPSQSPKQNP